MSKLIYMLNRMENAAQASDPSTAGYGLARREVLEYVEALEKRCGEAKGPSMPAKEKLPCACYTAPDWEGCTCGNYDDAHSQGYAQGWNAAIDAAMSAQSDTSGKEGGTNGR